MATVNSKKMENIFNTMTAEQKAANISALNYIKTLAANSSVDISKWDINKIFDAGDSINIVTEKKALNKLFFEAFEKSKIKEATKALNNPEAVAEAIEESTLDISILKKEIVDAAKKSREALIQTEKNNVTYQQTDVNRKLTELNRSQTTLLATFQRVRNLELVVDSDENYDKCLKDIQKVIDEKIWINPIFDQGFLYLNTAANVMLHEDNKTANLDLHLDFGQLAVRIDVRNGFGMSVIPYKNNINYGGYFHPHVNPEGIICWGETLTVQQKHLAGLEIEKCLRLLHSIMNVYNPGSPHRRLADFKLHHTKMGRVGDNLKHPDKRRKPKDEPVVLPSNAGENVGMTIMQAIQPPTVAVDYDNSY